MSRRATGFSSLTLYSFTLFLQIYFKWVISKHALAHRWMLQLSGAPVLAPTQMSAPVGAPLAEAESWAAEGWAVHPTGMVMWHWKYLGEVYLQGKLRHPKGEARRFPSVWMHGQGLGRGDGATHHLQDKSRLVLGNHVPTWAGAVAWGETSMWPMTGLACTSGKWTLFLGCVDKLHQTTHLLCASPASEMECERGLCRGGGKGNTWCRRHHPFC